MDSERVKNQVNTSKVIEIVSIVIFTSIYSHIKSYLLIDEAHRRCQADSELALSSPYSRQYELLGA